MKIEVTQANNNLSLALIGECGIENADKMKTAILNALNSSISVTLDLERVTEVDLCLYQLICSAHRYAITEGKSFCLAPARAEVFTRNARRTGYFRTIGCDRNPFDDCLWIEVEK